MADVLETDALIVGAGPGGCAAALQLARHGVRTILIDRSTFPRDKVCGDALSGKVMRTLERLDPRIATDLWQQAETRPSRGVTFIAPGGRALRVPFVNGVQQGQAPGAILPRLHFDAMLVDAVKRDGRITVLENRKARHFERTGLGWAVADDKREVTIKSRMVLAADGANSAFARHIGGLPLDPRHHAAGVRAYYHGVAGLDPDGFIELFFLKELLPGYLWIFPLPGGRANVGLGVRSDVVRRRHLDLKAELRRLIREHPQLKGRFARAEQEGPVHGMGLPLASERLRISGDGYLLIGDAAHLIDPFTGEGIGHALISGVYAADMTREALASGRTDVSFLSAYDDRVWKRLGKELAISTRLQQLAKKAWLFDLVVDRAIGNPALAQAIGSMFTDMDLRERLKQPGFYMDLLLGRPVR